MRKCDIVNVASLDISYMRSTDCSSRLVFRETSEQANGETRIRFPLGVQIDNAIEWQAFRRAKPYSCASINRCNLCLWEKYFIICKPELATLNKRNELLSSCRHAKKFLLTNI